MNVGSAVTETVAWYHLRALLEKKAGAAIVSDYDDDAHFHSEAGIRRPAGESPTGTRSRDQPEQSTATARAAQI